MSITKNDFKIAAIFVLVGFLVGPHILTWQKERNTPQPEPGAELATPMAHDAAPIDPFQNIALTAKSAYVWDIATQRTLYTKDGQTPRTLASITKMMTAVVALESKASDKDVSIAKEDLEVEGATDLRRGERWSLENLLKLTLVESSNHGASAVAASVGSAFDATAATHDAAQAAFIAQMNAKSQQLGLDSFKFNSPSGLDNGDIPGGTGSAHDVAMLFEYVLRHHGDLLQYTAQPKITVTSEQHITHHVTNTDEIAADTPGIIGGKTGFTDMAGGNLAIVVDVGFQHPVAIVALGSTREQRFTDVKKLVAATQLAVDQEQQTL